MKIVNVSTVHKFHDTRIQKHLLGEDSHFVGFLKGEIRPGDLRLYILNLGRYSAFKRIFYIFYLPFALQRMKGVDVFIFHDPELLFCVLIMRLLKVRSKIVFDAHENILDDINEKVWINAFLRRCLRWMFSVLLNIALPKCDLLLTVTPRLVTLYKRYNSKVLLLPNYPLTNEVVEFRLRERFAESTVCYIGSISVNRGIKELLYLSKFCDNPIHLIGDFTSSRLQEQCEKSPEWENIVHYGFLDAVDAEKIMSGCTVGILFLDNIYTFKNSIPVKIFDYFDNRCLILWTGASDCEYADILNDTNSIKIGNDLASIYSYDFINMEIDASVSFDRSSYSWQEYHKRFLCAVS